jgi:hypothetical protein
MFPIEAEDLRRRIVEEIVPTYLSDNSRMRSLQADGTYTRLAISDERPRRSQIELLALAASREEAGDVDDSSASSFDAISALANNGELQRGSKRKKKKRSAAR